MVRGVAFVKVTELLSLVFIIFISIMSVSHQSCRTKCLMSICRVHFVGYWVDTINRETLLS